MEKKDILAEYDEILEIKNKACYLQSALEQFENMVIKSETVRMKCIAIVMKADWDLIMLMDGKQMPWEKSF